MQITLVLDNVAPNPFVFVPLDCLALICQPSWMAAILQYGGRAQCFNFF